MKEIPVSVGKTYAVTTAESCTVTDADGRELCTAESGSQSYFTANGYAVTLSDDAATVTQVNFKQALAALGLLGGGDKLPAGYTRVEFLESSGAESINTEAVFFNTSRLTVRCSIPPITAQIGWLLGSDSLGNVETRRFLVGLSCYDESRADTGWQCFGVSANGGNYRSAKRPVQPITLAFSAEGLFVDGEQVKNPYSVTTDNEERVPMTLFASARKNEGEIEIVNEGLYRIYEFEMSGATKRRMVPVLDPTGAPCMYDFVTRKPFKNSGEGAFIAGIKDAEQLRTVLRKLPNLSGQDMGTLTLTIPAEANTPEMQELLDTTKAQKNWNLPIQERAAEVATYSLRRVRKVVWVRKLREENGSYVDADGERWQTEWCSAIYSPRGNDPTLHGYEPFDSVEQAVAAWGLVPYEYPEELSTEE